MTRETILQCQSRELCRIPSCLRDPRALFSRLPSSLANPNPARSGPFLNEIFFTWFRGFGWLSNSKLQKNPESSQAKLSFAVP
jgi:hypothetical protein